MNHSNYLFALVDGGGTVPPELAAVRRLVERGASVTVLAEDSMRDEVLATGAAWQPWMTAPNRPTRLPEDDPYRDWECKNPMQLFDRLIERQFVGPAPAYAADVERALVETQADVVLCSFFVLGAMVAAEAAGVPYRVLMPNIYLLPAPGRPPFGLGLQPARGPLGRLRDRAIGGFTTRQWDRKGLPGLNDLRRSRGLPPLEHFFDQIHHADREIVMTSTAFDFPGALPENVAYVGPVLDDAAWCEPWSPPAGDAPVVLVALSSTFQDQTACLQRVIDALAMLPVQAIVTTGPALDPTLVQEAPNVTVVRSAPHTEVLRHAAAVVNHGGHGTVMKALAAGVPQLVVPHGRDQADNAARVVARGAGLTLKRSAKPEAIAAAVRRLLGEPSFAASAKTLGAQIRADAESGDLEAQLVRRGEPCLSA